MGHLLHSQELLVRRRRMGRWWWFRYEPDMLTYYLNMIRSGIENLIETYNRTIIGRSWRLFHGGGGECIDTSFLESYPTVVTTTTFSRQGRDGGGWYWRT